MAPKFFISYRRDDSAGYSGRVHDRLQREFGNNLLFMDVDSIPLGVNFSKVLVEEVAKCDVLLVVIGPGWLDARDEKGHRRLENSDDFVRIEIGTALKRGIPVIPILLEGTRVPKADRLPDDLKELALRNGLNVRHASFSEDMERLIRGLKGAQSQQGLASLPIRLSPTATSGRCSAMLMDVHQRGNLRFPKSLPEFQRLFPDDAACAAYLEKARWSDGFVCPHCQAAGEPFRFANRPGGVLRCRKCRRDTGLTVGTVMARSHTPLSVWFWSACVVSSQTPGVSAVQLRRQLGLSALQTAFKCTAARF